MFLLVDSDVQSADWICVGEYWLIRRNVKLVRNLSDGLRSCDDVNLANNNNNNNSNNEFCTHI